MKFCPYCGSGLRDNMMFCPKCGKAFEDVAENPNMVNADINESIETVEQDVIRQQEHSIVEESTENIETADKETIKVEPLKETCHKKRKLWPWFLTACVLFAIIAMFLFVMQYKENISDGKVSSEFITDDANNPTIALRELTSNEIATFSNSVLTLYVYDESDELLSTGSGFVAFDDKTIITNYHVIDKGHSVEAFSEDGNCYNIDTVSYYDKNLDIAVLEFEKGMGIEPLPIGDSSTINVGDTVYAIGSPLGLSNTLSNGLVSAIREEDGYTDIQITAPISSGSSGGALFNIYGQVIGITYASYSEGQNLNLAIPSNEFLYIEKNGAKKLAEVALFERPLGNTVENYSGNANVVQYGNLIFEACNSKEEIYCYNCETGERKRLGFYGSCLSVYKDVLFFISPSKEAICSLNIITDEFNSNILVDYPKEAHIKEIISVFVSDYGMTVIYESAFLTASLLQLDFNGSIVGFVEGLSMSTTLADETFAVSPDYDNSELDFIQLHNCEIVSVPLGFSSVSCLVSEGCLYFDCKQYIARYDIYTGLVDKIYLPYNYKFCAGVFGGNIFFATTDGTQKMSILGKNSNMITEMYSFTSMGFSDDGYIYAFGRTVSKKEKECYARISIDGSFIEELDSRELSGKIATFD